MAANRRIMVPPGGFAGFAQQTPAVQGLMRKKTATKRRPAAKKKRVAKRAPAKRRAVRKSPGKKPARLVKGSAAARRHMAKLRKMRKR